MADELNPLSGRTVASLSIDDLIEGHPAQLTEQAAALGLSPQALARYHSGAQVPKRKATRRRLAAYYGEAFDTSLDRPITSLDILRMCRDARRARIVSAGPERKEA